MASLSTERRPSEKPFGQIPFQHHVLKCSSCGKELLDVTVINPEADVTNRWRADCPYCGDHSRAVEIRGGVMIGCTDHVVHTTTDAVDDVFHLRTAYSARAIPR